MAIAATIAVDLIARTEAFASAMKDTTSKLKDVGTQMKDIGTTMSTYVTAPIVGGFALAAAAADRQATAEAKLQAVIRATGGVAGVTAEHVTELARSLQRTTTFGDEATIAGAAVLLTFRSIRNELGEGNQIFDRTIAVGQDLAALMGNDLQGAMVMLGKALEEPVVGLTALRRVGVSFDESQRELISTLVESGETLEAQRVILDALETQVGGTAEAIAQTAGGKMRQAFNDVGDAMERVGRVFDPIRIKLSDGVSRLAIAFQSLPDGVVLVSVAVAGLAAAVGPLLVVFGTLITSFSKVVGALPGMIAAFNTLQTMVSSNVIPAIAKLNAVLLANPVVLVVAALTALAAAFVYVYQRSETFRELTEGMVRPIINLATAIRDGLGATVTWIGNAFANVFGSIADVISGFVGGALNFLGGLLPQGVRDSIIGFRDNLTGGVRSAVDTAAQIISELRAPSLDLGVTGSNAAARDALYGPVISASTEAAETIRRNAEAYRDSLIEGARLNTLNGREVSDLIRLQGMYRERLAAGNLSLQERNQITTDLNRVTEATTSAMRVNVGELAVSTVAMGTHNRGLNLATIEIGAVTRSMGHLQAGVQKASSVLQDIGTAGKAEIMGFLSQFGPVAFAMELLGEVFKVLQPIIDALKEPFKLIAQIIGRALIPILQAFWPIIRLLAIAFSYVAEIFFNIAGGIAKAVGGAIAAIGGVIAKIPFLGSIGRGIQEQGRAIQNVGTGFRQAAQDMKELRDSLRNMDLGEVGETEKTNALLIENNDQQMLIADNTQRIADAIEDGAMKPDVTINVTVQGGGSASDIGIAISEELAGEIERILGESTLRDERLDGLMAI
jgi:hypothetical protein